MDTASVRPGSSGPASASRRRLADRLLVHAPVLATDQIAARMTRIRLDLAGLATPDWIPGQHVRVVVGAAPFPKDWILGQMRTYSIWECTPDHLDLAVLDHGDGPGAEWARHARPGQLVAFTRPQGTLTARPSGSHLLIGEETAAVAVGAILRALPAGQSALPIIETDEPGAQLPLPGRRALALPARAQRRQLRLPRARRARHQPARPRHRLPGRRGTHHPGTP